VYDYKVTPHFSDDELGNKFSSYTQINKTPVQKNTNIKLQHIHMMADSSYQIINYQQLTLPQRTSTPPDCRTTYCHSSTGPQSWASQHHYEYGVPSVHSASQAVALGMTAREPTTR
jgi:hypothetical protein